MIDCGMRAKETDKLGWPMPHIHSHIPVQIDVHNVHCLYMYMCCDVHCMYTD